MITAPPRETEWSEPELVLGPATRLLWRGPDAVQLELGSSAVVVEGLPPSALRRVASPVAPAPASAPAPEGPLDSASRHVLTALSTAGYLWPRTAAEGADVRRLPAHPRLAGELDALTTRHGERAAAVLATRRKACVEVGGDSRTAAHLAAVLAAAGVGRVWCSSDGDAKLAQTMPGGVRPADEGRPMRAATDAALHQVAPEVDTTPLPADQKPDLTVLALDGPVADERVAALHAVGAPYLAVTLGTDHGVVGPLVVPGLSTCVRCTHLHRRDRHPAWPALAVQLSVGRRHGPASQVAVATTLVGVACLQVLTYLDGGEPASLDGTLELRLPDWRLRRRSWALHPECGCSGGG